jgi:hypothetical protein
MTKHEPLGDRASSQTSGVSSVPNQPRLAAPEKGNVRALKHAAYTTRFSEPRREEIVSELMALPSVSKLDLPAARELASLMVQAERVDAALADGRVETSAGDLRALLEHRRRLSRQLERWFTHFGLTPAARLAQRAGQHDPVDQDRDFTADLREIPDDELARMLDGLVAETAVEMKARRDGR